MSRGPRHFGIMKALLTSVSEIRKLRRRLSHITTFLGVCVLTPHSESKEPDSLSVIEQARTVTASSAASLCYVTVTITDAWSFFAKFGKPCVQSHFDVNIRKMISSCASEGAPEGGGGLRENTSRPVRESRI